MWQQKDMEWNSVILGPTVCRGRQSQSLYTQSGAWHDYAKGVTDENKTLIFLRWDIVVNVVLLYIH